MGERQCTLLTQGTENHCHYRVSSNVTGLEGGKEPLLGWGFMLHAAVACFPLSTSSRGQGISRTALRLAGIGSKGLPWIHFTMQGHCVFAYNFPVPVMTV